MSIRGLGARIRGAQPLGPILSSHHWLVAYNIIDASYLVPMVAFVDTVL